ncbi:hypothetical protein HDV02_004315 [Globomyces sp. JEL0801]|nr:hypothetical protein HDV02_004315 [Globomyces sp. JEL0801]
MDILNLPLEILLRTSEYLDTLSVVNLSSSSKHFLSFRRFVIAKKTRLVLTDSLRGISKFIWQNIEFVDIAPANLTTLNRFCKRLEKVSNVKQVHIDYHKSFNVNALSKLGHIRSLQFGGVKGFKNLSALSALSALKELAFCQCQVEDSSALSSLIHLRKLIFHGIPSIILLSDLINLEELNISFSRINDISPLSTLVNITTLKINVNRVNDLNPLKNMKKLKVLELSSN